MPNIGLSRPYVAEHVYNGHEVTYKNGMRAGRAVEAGYELNDSGDGNDFYCDNAIGESLRGVFTGGTFTMTTAELERAVAKVILGLTTRKTTVGDEEVTVTVYSADAVAPNLGLGFIVKAVVNSNTIYHAYVFKKVAFNVPSADFATQGEEIEWQTRELDGVIMRDELGEWMTCAESLKSEALADRFIRQTLGMSIEDIGELAVTSVAGTAEGYTSISITPTLSVGNKYMYKLGSNFQLPYYGQGVSEEDGFAVWDGEAEIDAADMQQILVVEATSSDTAVKAGISGITVFETPEG